MNEAIDNNFIEQDNMDEIPVKVYSDVLQLRFNGQLEQAFQTAYSRDFNVYIRYVMIVATVIYMLSGLYDYVLLTPRYAAVLQVRYILGTPPLLLLCVYAFSHNFWRFQQPVLLSFMLVITLTLMLMNASFISPAMVGFSKDSRSITWHQ